LTDIRFNALQQPKSPGYLAAFKARPGYKLVQCDLASIEPRIIAEFSRDPNLWKLYGPDAKPNDVYLYNGAHIGLFSEQLRRVYDPDNPTAETISEAKKKFKAIRNFNKAITLACGYGAGVPKVRSMLITMGFPVTRAEVDVIHRDYWKLYSGIRDFQATLEQMWAANGGWFPNISGRPICVAQDYLHDSVNRFAQSSGHDVLMKFIFYTQQLRREQNLQMYPWLVDYYDEQIWEAPESQAERVCDAYLRALDRTNDELGMEVQILGEPQIADNLAEIKCPDEYKLWLEGCAV
jgi:hypothetical protein